MAEEARPGARSERSHLAILMRDPERIPMILAALERHWRHHPDHRLGQVIVNLLRTNANVPYGDEVLFNVEDGELLRWLGPETEEEETYIREDPRRAREGWRAWDRSFRESQPDEESRESAGACRDEEQPPT